MDVNVIAMCISKFLIRWREWWIVWVIQDLSERLSQCTDAVSAQNQDGGRLTELVGTEAASKLKDMVSHSSQVVSSVEERIKLETDRVKLQRQKSLEVV